MARTQVFRLFLVAVMVLALASTISIVVSSNWYMAMIEGSANSLPVGGDSTLGPGTIMAGPCDGCSGGSGGGG